MRIYSIIICLLSLSTGTNAQKNGVPFKEDLGMKMEKSGEHAPRPEVSGSTSDYPSFIKAKAWNAQLRSSEILSNTKELDFPKIGGRVRATLADEDNSIFLVAPSGGGLWHFSPDGSSFTPIDDLGEFLAITDISQNPFNKQQIIIGTGDEQHGTSGNGLFISNDGGSNFSHLVNTDPLINNKFQYIRFVKFSPNTANLLYLSAGKELFKSVDGGVNWSSIYTAPSTIRSLDFTSGNGVIIAVQNNGVYHSSTGNSGTFSLLTNGIVSGANAGNIVLATHKANRNVLYSLVEKSGVLTVYKTANGGTNWTETTQKPIFSYIGQGWFSLCIGVHPTNPNIIFVGNVSLGYSIDGGANWLNARGFEVDFHDIRIHESNPDLVYIGYDQGFGTLDLGNTELAWGIYSNGSGGFVWGQDPQGIQTEIGKNPGFNTMQVYYGDFYPETYGDAYCAGFQDGGVMYQINGTDRRAIAGDGGSIFINKQNPNKSFASLQYNRVFFTDKALVPNGGDFNEVKATDYNTPFITQFAGNNADGNQIYIASKTTIERSSNDGALFTNIASHALASIKIATEHATDPIVYAFGRNSSTNNNNIIRIENAASSPSIKTLSVDYFGVGVPDQITVDPNDRNSIYFASTSGSAYKYSELDQPSPVATDIKGNISDVRFNVVIGVAGVPDLLIAGTNVGLFTSQDAGVTWTLSSAIPYTQITDLKFRESDNRLFVFTFGRGTFATTVSLSTVGVDQTNQIEFSIFPNPTSEQITVSIDEDVNIIMFDQSGKKVLTSTQKTFSVRALSKGLYILHLQTQQGLIATESVVIK